MPPDRANVKLSDYLMYPADALAFTVVAGAVLVALKGLTAIPAPWTDSLNAFHITITIASIAGAGIAWLLHRRSSGVRGLLVLAAALASVIAAIFVAQGVINSVAETSPGIAPLYGTITQALGLAGLLALSAAAIVHLVRPPDHRFDAVALARLVVLGIVAAFIVMRFLPETRASAAAAPFYAIVGFATSQGALGALLGDAVLAVARRWSARRGPATATEREAR